MLSRLWQGQVWTPKSLGSALLCWWRADAGVTLNGSTVSSWADQSGNGKTLSQATAARQPTYDATGLNGFPCITFDGVDDVLSVSHLTELDGVTGMVFAAAVEPTNRTAYWALAYMRNSSDGFILDSLAASPSSGWRFAMPGGGGFGQAASYGTSSLSPVIVAGQFASSRNYIYTDNVQRASFATTGSTVVANTQPLYIGSRAPGTSPAPIKVREIVIASTGLTTGIQLAQLNKYLAQRTGL